MYQNIFYEKSKNLIHIWDDKLGYYNKKFEPYFYIKSINGKYTSIFNDKLKKLTGNKNVNHYKNNKNTFEIDVKPEVRFLVDNYFEDSTPSEQNICFYDIEVNWQSNEEFDDAVKNVNDEITSITCWLSKFNQYFVFILDPDDKLNNIKKVEEAKVYIFKTEKKLLTAFMKFIKNSEITILSGWNSWNFDDIYTFNRLQKVFKNKDILKKLSPIDKYEYQFWKNFNQYKIAGISLIDYLETYKNFTYSEKSSYSLDNIAKDELGEKKLSYNGDLNSLYFEDRLKYLKYNLQDVRLMVKLEKKLSYMEILISVAHIGHVPYEKALNALPVIDGAVLTYLKNKNLIAPTKHEHKKEPYPGAYVKFPQKGRHEWIFDLDFASLYPSIIKTLNMSIETKITRIKDWNKDVEYVYLFNKKVTKDELKEFLYKNDYCISSHGVIFNLKKKGVVPTILSEWLDIRADHKKLRRKYKEEKNDSLYEKYDKSQHAYKILANSFYGVLANEFFRFNDIDIAASITLTGQNAIKYAEKSTNKYFEKELGYYKDWVIMIDTDSVCSTTKPLMKKIFKNKWKDNPIKYSRIICKTIEDYVNKDMDNFAEKDLCINKKYPHFFKLKQEWIGDAGLFVTKKRYGLHLVSEDKVNVDKMEIKGLDIVRSSYPELFQNFLTEILKKILKGEKKENIDKYIIDFKKYIKKNKLIFEVATPTGVNGMIKYSDKSFQGYKKGTPIHVKAAINFNNWLEKNNLKSIYNKINTGNKIKWIYLKEKFTGFSEIAFPGDNMPKELEEMLLKYVDYDKIFDRQIDKKVMLFYNALNWKEILNKENTFDSLFG